MTEVTGKYEIEDNTDNARAMIGMDDQDIFDDSDLRKYRIELPNLYDDSDLDPYEFRLLAHYKRVGRCTEGTRTTAKKCKMSPAQVSERRRSLHEKGFIVMIEKPLPQGGYSYSITVVDKWRENFDRYTPRSLSEHPRSLSETKNLEDEDFSKIITHWQNTHTFLNPTHANLLGCMLDEWRDHARRLPAGHPDREISPAEVLIKAADITAKNARNPHSISYMDQVVKNFIQLGIGIKPNQKQAVSEYSTL